MFNIFILWRMKSFLFLKIYALAICNIVPIFIIKNSNKGEKG